MEKLDFAELHSEKLALIFENIEILSNMKESDTQLPPRFFREITDDVIFDYKAKIGILNKNTKFVTRELMKDFRLLRREQKRRQTKKRNAHLRFARRSSAPVTYGQHTGGDSRPCARVDLVLPVHPVTCNTFSLFAGVLWTIRLK